LPLIPAALITVATRIFDVSIARNSPPRSGPNVLTSRVFFCLQSEFNLDYELKLSYNIASLAH
jgi:hypothetical protein